MEGREEEEEEKEDTYQFVAADRPTPLARYFRGNTSEQ